MATIKKRGNSYLIRVSCGYDINGNHKEQSMTWKPDEGMTKKQIEKELNRQAVMFEESVNHGFKTSAMKFQDLAEEWFENYAKNALRSTPPGRQVGGERQTVCQVERRTHEQSDPLRLAERVLREERYAFLRYSQFPSLRSFGSDLVGS